MSTNFPKAIAELVPKLMGGLGIVIETTIVGFIVAFIIALIIALCNLGKNNVIKFLLWILMEIVRGTPLLVQMVYVYYVIPILISGILQFINPAAGKFRISAFVAGVIALGINYGCYMSEVIRSAVESIDIGQTEAALALGYTEKRALIRIVLPQGLRISVANFANYLVIMVKDTSLLSYITISELLLLTKSYASQTFLTVESYTILALFYLIVCFPLMRIVKILEKKVVK